MKSNYQRCIMNSETICDGKSICCERSQFHEDYMRESSAKDISDSHYNSIYNRPDVLDSRCAKCGASQQKCTYQYCPQVVGYTRFFYIFPDIKKRLDYFILSKNTIMKIQLENIEYYFVLNNTLYKMEHGKDYKRFFTKSYRAGSEWIEDSSLTDEQKIRLARKLINECCFDYPEFL